MDDEGGVGLLQLAPQPQEILVPPVHLIFAGIKVPACGLEGKGQVRAGQVKHTEAKVNICIYCQYKNNLLLKSHFMKSNQTVSVNLIVISNYCILCVVSIVKHFVLFAQMHQRDSGID